MAKAIETPVHIVSDAAVFAVELDVYWREMEAEHGPSTSAAHLKRAADTIRLLIAEKEAE